MFNQEVVYSFDREEIARVTRLMSEQTVDYPSVFARLKKAGVLFLDMDISLRTGVFQGEGEAYEKVFLDGQNPVEVAKQFSLERLKQILEKRAQGLISYAEFHQGLADAGIQHVKIDFVQGIQYFMGGQEVYEKPIPR